jgi:membrane protein required for colicin V production
MNLLDISIFIVIALSTIRGFFRGFIQEASTILGLIASFFLASYYYNNLTLWLARFFPHHRLLLTVFCFLLLFFLCLYVFHLVALMIRKAIRLVFLGWLDRVLGGLFGLIKGTIIIFVLVTVLMLFYPKSSPIIKDSHYFPSILTFTEKLMFLIPEKIKEDYLNKKKNLQDMWQGKKPAIRKKEKRSNGE